MPPKVGVVVSLVSGPLLYHLAALLVTQLGTSLINEFLVHTLNFRHASFLGLLGPVGIALSGVLTGGLSGRQAPLRSHVVAGVALFLAGLLGSKAQLHLAYSEFLVAKASKLAPTMLIGAVWLKKRYSRADILAAVLALAGLTLVLHCGVEQQHGADAVGGEDDDEAIHAQQCAVSRLQDGNWLTGIGCISAALLCDGLYANTQEQQMLQWGAASREVASWGMGIASVLFVASSAFSRGLWHGMQAAAASPLTALALLAYAGGNYGASLTALNAVRDLGAAKASFLLAVCKAFAVIASMALFPKATTPLQLGGIVLVFAAVAVAILHKSASQHQLARAAASPAALQLQPEPAPPASSLLVRIRSRGAGLDEPPDAGGGSGTTLTSRRRVSVPQSTGGFVPPPLNVGRMGVQDSPKAFRVDSSGGGGGATPRRAAKKAAGAVLQLPATPVPVMISTARKGSITGGGGEEEQASALEQPEAEESPCPASQTPSPAPPQGGGAAAEDGGTPLSGSAATEEAATPAADRPASIESARDRRPPPLAGALPERSSSAPTNSVAAALPAANGGASASVVHPGASSTAGVGRAPPVFEVVQGSARRLLHRAVASPLVSRALLRIATASELALDGVSTATGIERPHSALHDSLSPLATQPPRPAHWKMLRRGVSWPLATAAAEGEGDAAAPSPTPRLAHASTSSAASSGEAAGDRS